MGFFSSNKANDTNYIHDDRTVVQVIRSRFYGKYKGKERAAFPDSSPSLSSSRDKFMTHKPNESRPKSRTDSRETHAFMHSVSDHPGQHARAHTDTVTTTLAQRLNELATANSEGLLDNEEYRLLRQNLFERLTSSSPVPVESPMVPMVNHGDSQGERSQKRLSSATHLSQNNIPGSLRSPSIRSKSSKSSAISNLFARVTTRRTSMLSKDDLTSDASSVFSSSSKISQRYQQHEQDTLRGRSKRYGHVGPSPSQSHIPCDMAASSSNLENGLSHRAFSSSGSFRSTHSIRRLGKTTPPSSFPTRIPGSDHIHTPSLSNIDTSGDDELKSTQELRRDLASVEAEGRRLLDAFNGLELTALTRNQYRPTGTSPVKSSSSSPLRPQKQPSEHLIVQATGNAGTIRRRGYDNDGMSVHSNSSIGTGLSRAVPYRSTTVKRPNAPLTAPIPVVRKNSVTSMSSRTRDMASSPVPSQSHVGANGSSISLTKFSTHNMSIHSQPEDDEFSALEAELTEIRRRRKEVTARYQGRLEYLRAQLKGAELREKLQKK
ncbi:hypothetical protein SERLA73DRAFT_169105 [Serpula lacrymans var. lacrymans S7.3]|uniref:Uncharacterized protein n=2 Tax=Serpula lacrymans var. lacrymans TaxID=341189 RepID=F8Q144_SERL3|nr:uncharacterized protein SERLADRAFT_469723 [Serpula lacrymans var. lacrymans S7.9]EGN98022.1 hypothetical protein SERLA73DRAFT_169105 [Serpula lacrymans var. lacrymans S7.3]EGO23612.1 hypothetical protein SERLADRAFT_469723 [Serpula lacrymans var. lacrymans S7.9]